MSSPEEFWENRFHFCALAAGFIAVAEGRLHESDYVKQLCYEMFESGAAGKDQANKEGGAMTKPSLAIGKPVAPG